MLVKTENNRSFFAVCITNFLVRMEWGIATGLMPIQIYELGGSPIEVGLVFTVFSSIQVVSPLLWGALSDSLGRRKIFIVTGMLGLPPIYLLIANQKTILLLILLRGTTAIFKGAVVTCSWALVSDLSTPDKVGRNMGVLGFSELAGFGVGPVVGGLIAEQSGFSTLWYSVALICLAGGLVFLIAGRDSSKLRRGKKDSSTLHNVWRKSLFMQMLVISLAYAVLLVSYSFLGPNLNVYLTRDLGYSKSAIGLILLSGTGIATFLQLFFGYVSDRWSRRLVMILGCISLSLGHLVLLQSGQILWVVLSQTLIQCHNAFFMAAAAHVADTISFSEKSRALSLLDSIGSIARAASAVAGGLVIAITDVQTALKIAAAFPAVTILIVTLMVKSSSRPEVAQQR